MLVRPCSGHGRPADPGAVRDGQAVLELRGRQHRPAAGADRCRDGRDGRRLPPGGKSEPKQTKSPEASLRGPHRRRRASAARTPGQAPPASTRGNRSVPASNVYDGDLTTACAERRRGRPEDAARPVRHGPDRRARNLPGYAKTDPRSGADRYAQNNGSPRCAGASPTAPASCRTRRVEEQRDLQTMAIPLVEANASPSRCSLRQREARHDRGQRGPDRRRGRLSGHASRPPEALD